MTSDAIRQPGDSTRPPAEPTAPSASEAIPPGTDEPGTTTPEENATPSAGEVTGQAAASADAADAEAADATVPQTTDAQASDTAATDAQTETASAEAIASSEAVSPADTVTTAEAVAATEAAADAPAVPGPRRRERVGMVLRRLAVVALAIALLVGGVALGSAIFQRTRPAGDVIPPGQVGITAEQPALVTQEFIGALRANDFDAMRSSMQPEAALHFADEIERRGVMKIDKVEVLGTHVAGQRSATEILMQYQSDQELPLSINLVILVDGGKIEGFR